MRPRSVAVALGTLLLSVPTAAARFGMPDPVTGRGEIIEGLYAKLFLIGAGVFALVFVLLAYVLWKYRASSEKGRATHEKHRGSMAAEATWTLIPLAIVLWVGVAGYQGLVTLDAPQEGAMELRIIGAQWTWIADYGDGVTVSSSPGAEGEVADENVFYVPADTPVDLNVTGADVIHSFYIQDAGGGPVGMVDANPAGPHRYSHFVVNLPAGEYRVQCKEMCHNPGHAYMRARIVSVPPDDFAFWLAKKELAVGAELVQEVDVKASAFASLADQTVVAGTRIVVAFENDGDAPVVLEATGAGAVQAVAGATILYAFDVAQPGATYNLTASGLGTVAYRALEATVVTVDLGAFRLIPDHLDLQAGTTYLIQLRNVHTTVHNLYIGHYGDGTEATSIDLQAGEDGSFTWTPTEAGEYEMWCNVPGHYGLGMKGTVTVG